MRTVPQSSGERPWKPKWGEEENEATSSVDTVLRYDGSNLICSTTQCGAALLHCMAEAVALERLL